MSTWPSAEQTLLLRAALLEHDAGRAAYEQWKSQVVLDGLDRGSVRLLPLLHLNLRAAGVTDALTPRFEAAFVNAASHNRTLIEAVAPVLDALRVERIETIVLKGMPLAVLYYAAPGARPMSDCDVLVRKGDVPAARNVLEGDGWQSDAPITPGFVAVRHAMRFSKPSGVGLDLHWHVQPECSDADADAAFWQAADPVDVGGAPTRMLCPADLILHVCVHGLRWSITPPVRWAADAWTVIRAVGAHMDWQGLIDQAQRRDLTLPIAKTLRYLRDALDAPVPAWVPDRLARLPASRRARLEHRVKMHPRTATRQFLMHWIQHRRLAAHGTLAGDLARFPRYLQQLWGLSSLAEVVPRLLQKTRATWAGQDRS